MRATFAFSLVSCVLLVFACGASAQDLPPGNDVVGLYTNDFDGPTWAHYEGMGPQVTAYIVFTNITRPGIGGWELEVTQDGSGVLFLSATVFGGAVVVFPGTPSFQSQLASPITVTAVPGAWPVASLLYFILSSEPTTLSIGPVSTTSWPEDPGPGYANAEDIGDLVRCHTHLIAGSGVSFGFNAGLGIRPVDDHTWGAIKGMFD